MALVEAGQRDCGYVEELRKAFKLKRVLLKFTFTFRDNHMVVVECLRERVLRESHSSAFPLGSGCNSLPGYTKPYHRNSYTCCGSTPNNYRTRQFLETYCEGPRLDFLGMSLRMHGI